MSAKKPTYEDLQYSLTACQWRCSQLKNEKQILVRTIKDLKKDIQKMQRELFGKNETIDNLRGTIARVEGRKDSLDGRMRKK